VVDRDNRPGVAHFFSTEPVLSAGALVLGEDAAHHARVRRLAIGAPVTVRDGEGTSASGTIVRMAKQHLEVEITAPRCPPPLPPVHLLVPVADKERMLWLAEKATELGVTSWRPVLWRRSKSVAGRGEGPMFSQKIESRMIAALLQSEGTWLPQRFSEANAERAIAGVPSEGTRLLLDVDGDPIAQVPASAPVTIALGPEGGLEDDERARLEDAGFRRVRLAGGVLRMETAAVAALAVVRARLDAASTRG
jgi:16S rRNA (uracil1498-N3)-methyltransferase